MEKKINRIGLKKEKMENVEIVINKEEINRNKI
jgi:hypothetical protein